MAKNNDKTQRDYPGIKTACLAMLALLFLLACVLLQGDGERSWVEETRLPVLVGMVFIMRIWL